jgi:nitroimidazol reductase NimA-like FMN-containing flavoprotein (pyridoxamine 5'-phosphate oxidase superfamily)
VCHLAFVENGEPFAIPMVYGRIGDRLYLHGSPASRLLRQLVGGAPACVSVTLVDGLVLARSAFHQSMNYRSVVLFGTAQPVTDAAEQLAALRAIVEHVIPGRWGDVRGPSLKELARTLVLWLPIQEASAKVRSGPALDEEEDYALDVWAGVIPLAISAGAPCDDPRLAPGAKPPAYAFDYRRPRARGDPP